MDILKVLVIISFVIVTICTIKLHPDMHHPMIIEDADFKLTRISDTLTTTTTSTSVRPTTSQTVQQPTNTVQQQEVFFDNNYQQTPQKTKYIQSEKVQPSTQTKRISQTSNSPDKSQIELLEKIIRQSEQEEIPKQTQQTPPQRPQQRTQQQTIQPKPQQQTAARHKNPYMTEQEEIIAWNKWRSNLQNQIMKDSDIDYAPLGTLFMFTFVVDKFGNVSNIKVQCSNPQFMDVARNNVKPAIARLQQKPILNFPRGTQRVSTIVVGAFLIGTQERYSTPNDYADFERIKY